MAIVGSHIITIFNLNGLDKIEEFIKLCRENPE